MTDQPEFFPGFIYSDLKAAMAWLETAFGFKTTMAVPNDDESFAHVEMAYGPIIIMPSGPRKEMTWKSPQEVGATTASVYVYIPDEELRAHYERAKAAGAEIVFDFETKDYGGSGYSARDLDGHFWSFGSYRPRVTPA